MDLVGSYFRVFTVNYVKKKCIGSASYALQLQCKIYRLRKKKTAIKSLNSILSSI